DNRSQGQSFYFFEGYRKFGVPIREIIVAIWPPTLRDSTATKLAKGRSQNTCVRRGFWSYLTCCCGLDTTRSGLASAVRRSEPERPSARKVRPASNWRRRPSAGRSMQA